MNTILPKDLRKLNTSKYRTDIENLMLREMVIADTADILKESDELDMLIPETKLGLFDEGNEDNEIAVLLNESLKDNNNDLEHINIDDIF